MKRPWLFICRFIPAQGMALFPFILLKHPSDRTNMILIRHEQIHLRQQLELLIIPFYLLYLSFYLINLCRFRRHYKAYMHIPFEREAYLQESNPHYLKSRRAYAWLCLNRPKQSS